MNFRDEVPAFTKVKSGKDFCKRESQISERFQTYSWKNEVIRQGVFFTEQGVLKKRLDVSSQTPRRFDANALAFYSVDFD